MNSSITTPAFRSSNNCCSHLVTYTSGYNLKVTRSITTHDLMHLCDRLQAVFSAKFGGEYVFQPEPISDGGVEWIQWPGKAGEQYKTMRIRFQQYCWVPQDVEELRAQDPVIIHQLYHKIRLTNATREQYLQQPDSFTIERSQKLSTFLKAFEGAPQWTTAELALFGECLMEIGLVPTNVSKVKVKDLRHRCMRHP